MDGLGIWVAIGLIALAAGISVGGDAERAYVERHCAKTGQMIVNKVAYTCAAKQ